MGYHKGQGGKETGKEKEKKDVILLKSFHFNILSSLFLLSFFPFVLVDVIKLIVFYFLIH